MDNHHDVKFILDVDVNEHSIEKAFNKAKDILNWQFDENFNAIQMMAKSTIKLRAFPI